MDPFLEVCTGRLAAFMNEYVQTEEQMPQKGKLVVRVYKGGEISQQFAAWESAWLQWLADMEVRSRIEVDLEVLSCRTLKSRGFRNAAQLVDFLLASHVHFILGHIHQGLETLGWDMRDLYQQQLPRLYYHSGFPTGKQLVCPVFTQDKFRYLCALDMNGYANPTLKISLDSLNQEEKEGDYWRSVVEDAINR